MTERTTTGREVATALEACGWRSADAAAARYSFPGRSIQLSRVGQHADWDGFVLDSDALPVPALHQIAEANHRLGGPVKWVEVDDHQLSCRADLPHRWTSAPAAARADQASDPRPGPVQAWAATLTGIALGRSPVHQASTPCVADLAGQLVRAGWAASVDEGQLRVHVHLTELYRAIQIDQFGPADWRVGASIMPWAGLRKLPRRAVRLYAAAADRRLPLVRLAVMPSGSGPELRTEVALPSSGACVPGEWVITAVEAVQLAVSLTARELLALRDAALAKLLLAGMSAVPVVKGGV